MRKFLTGYKVNSMEVGTYCSKGKIARGHRCEGGQRKLKRFGSKRRRRFLNQIMEEDWQESLQEAREQFEQERRDRVINDVLEVLAMLDFWHEVESDYNTWEDYDFLEDPDLDELL